MPTETPNTSTGSSPPPETQKQRWLKYGANVALATVVVVVLAVAATALAQKFGRRLDTTASGQYSLKPQTVNLIAGLKQPIKLVSLYRTTDPDGKPSPYAQRVIDLLDEYRSKGANISVEQIDPVASPGKVEDLYDSVASRYGGEVKKYRDFFDGYKEKYADLKKQADDEAAATAGLPTDKLGQDEVAQTAQGLIDTVVQLPGMLEKNRKTNDERLKQKHPDYKTASESVQGAADTLSKYASAIATAADRYKADQSLPPAIQAYLAAVAPRMTILKTKADAVSDQVKGLGTLKLDDLSQSLKARDAILVMGDADMRVLPFEQVWVADAGDVKNYAQGQELKPRFAGEQQVSTAVLALSQTKKSRVAFVRTGGPPLTDPGMPPFQPGGPFSKIAQRLRDYNFELVEKDLSGTYAMQAQMQRGQPPEPEATDEQLKDAVWVVVNTPAQQNPMGMPPPQVGPKVQAHLDAGGSALVMVSFQSESLDAALKPWGIQARPDIVAVHETTAGPGTPSGDQVEDAQKLPYIFVLKEFGDHLLAGPLRSLDALMVPVVPVITSKADGVKSTPLLPMEQAGTTWGESDVEGLQNGTKPAFDADKSDLQGPIFGGAAAERDKGGRLVVIGSASFAADRTVDIPDTTLLRRGVVAARFPGNAELFANSVFWLSRMETMIAISPSAMEVSRIGSMSDGALRFWRVGVLLVGLPLLVVVAGGLMYAARRD